MKKLRPSLDTVFAMKREYVPLADRPVVEIEVLPPVEFRKPWSPVRRHGKDRLKQKGLMK